MMSGGIILVNEKVEDQQKGTALTWRQLRQCLPGNSQRIPRAEVIQSIYKFIKRLSRLPLPHNISHTCGRLPIALVNNQTLYQFFHE